MLECSECIKKLDGLELSFEESVYVIAFDLADEIREKGKEAVFSELSCRENMAENVQKVMEFLSDDSIYALRRALGGERNEEIEAEFATSEWNSFDLSLEWAIKNLLGSRKLITLVGGMISGAESVNDSSRNTHLSSFDAEDLSAQLQQLMEEVRFYNERRDQALARIETLLSEIKERSDASKNLAVETMVDTLQDISADPIAKIHWPYRSLQVLRELELTDLENVIEYFSDFDNFVDSKKMTLWEWNVIVATLRREGLLSADKTVKVDLDTAVWDLFYSCSSSGGTVMRTKNCLCCGGISNVQELNTFFACGAREGWRRLQEIRNFGRVGLSFLVEEMRSWETNISPEACYPTGASALTTLDLPKSSLETLNAYRIETVGELIAVCEDSNRFRGLRYIDLEQYTIAVKQLRKYGFSLA